MQGFLGPAKQLNKQASEVREPKRWQKDSPTELLQVKALRSQHMDARSRESWACTLTPTEQGFSKTEEEKSRHHRESTAAASPASHGACSPA